MFLLQGWEISALRVIKWLPISSRTWRSSTLVAGIQCILIWYKNAAKRCQLESGLHSSVSVLLIVTLVSKETTVPYARAIHRGWWVPYSKPIFSFPWFFPRAHYRECSVVNVQMLPKHCDLAYWTSIAGLGKKEAIFLWLKAGTGS